MNTWLGSWLCCALLLAAGPVAAGADEPQQLTAITADGFRDVLAATRANGEPVVLINFWATWCKPCLDEIPIFLGLQKKYGAQGFRFVAVSLDEIETMDSTVLPFMQKWFPEFYSYISVEYDMDDMVSVIDNGWNEVLPTSYVFARDGSLSERLQGKYTAEEFAARIKPLL